jgi:hypothetical protein
VKRSIEWAAGLFEGEGCISIIQEKTRWIKNPGRLRVQLGLSMTDYDVVKDFADTFGMKVNGPYVYGKYKPIWRAATSKLDVVARILVDMLPHLGSRRAYKALNALDVIECKLSPEEYFRTT